MRVFRILAGAVLLAAGCATPSPSTPASPVASQIETAPQSPSDTATATSESPAASAMPAARAAWVSTGQPASAGLQTVNAIGWTAGRWVAVGENQDGQAAAWSSADAASWLPSSVASPGLPNSGTFIGDVTPFGSMLVAVGGTTNGGSAAIDRNGRPSTDSPDPSIVPAVARADSRSPIELVDTCEPRFTNADAAVWTTIDGEHWSRVPTTSAFHGLPMLAVTSVGTGLVAVGGSDGLARAASWTSMDGRTWTRGADSALLHQGFLWDVAALGDQAIGIVQKGCAKKAPRTSVWLSQAGGRWAAVDAFSSVERGGSPVWIAADPAGAVAIGAVTNGDQTVAATWTTSDGRQWAMQTPGFGALNAIVTVPDGFIVIADSAAWGSADGLAWRRLQTPSGFGADMVGVGPPGVLAIGDQIWTGPASASP